MSAKEKEISDIENQMQDPEFWQNHEKAGKLSAKLASLKQEADEFSELESKFSEISKDQESDSEVLSDFDVLIAKQEMKAFLSQPYDSSDAVVSVYSGAGGDDAQDWAGMLFRMYRRWAEKNKFQSVVIHEHQGESGGIKNASLKISGLFAYGYLRGESGVHRLVRISPFNAQQLRHTSFALVEVLPVIDLPESVKIREEDLEWGMFRSSGPGGQNVNKRETAVRVTHKPTGIQVSAQTTRSQQQNRELALEILRAKLVKMMQEQKVDALEKLRADQREPEWGSQIRSYVLHPYKMVKDHRTECETSDVESVLDGKLDEFIWKELEWLSGK